MTSDRPAAEAPAPEQPAGGRRRLVYILSPSFSGSTLLTLMLAQHPRIATIGELKATAMGATDSYACSCGSPIGDCAFWNGLRERCRTEGIPFAVEDFGTHFAASNRWVDRILGAQIRGGGFELLRRVLLALPPGASTYRSVLERNTRLIDLICELQGSDLFVDGSKDPQRLLYFQRSGNWDVRVIRMFRDGRAQSHSRRQKPRNPVNFEGAAREWKKTIGQMERVCEAMGAGRVHTLHYEALCADPNHELAEIWRFLDVEPVDQDWGNLDLKGTPHHILGNKMRTQSRIRLSLSTEWQEQMSAEEKEVFESIAGSTNRALGYGEPVEASRSAGLTQASPPEGG